MHVELTYSYLEVGVGWKRRENCERKGDHLAALTNSVTESNNTRCFDAKNS